MDLRVYGIKNCDSMKKTFQWLNVRSINYIFIDFKTTALTKIQISEWLEGIGNSLVNTRGKSYRQLDEATKANFTGQTRLDAIVRQPTLIKRPLLVRGDIMIVGFLPKIWTQTANLLPK